MKESTNVKIVVFVPTTHANVVRMAIGEAGGGKIGNYSFSSFSSIGTGRFKPEAGANPAIGQVGTLEAVDEERIEFVCANDLIESVVTAMKKAHPYEQMAYDIYPLLESES